MKHKNIDVVLNDEKYFVRAQVFMINNNHKYYELII